MRGIKMYLAVIRNIAYGTLSGCSFTDKDHFDKWYSEAAQKLIEVVEKDISPERVAELCSVPDK